MILVFWGPCQDITLVGSGIGCLMSAKELISSLICSACWLALSGYCMLQIAIPCKVYLASSFTVVFI